MTHQRIVVELDVYEVNRENLEEIRKRVGDQISVNIEDDYGSDPFEEDVNDGQDDGQDGGPFMTLDFGGVAKRMLFGSYVGFTPDDNLVFLNSIENIKFI
jgi:hypothetical protein